MKKTDVMDAVVCFEDFYSAVHDSQVAQVTWLLNGDRADAEDIVQQSMMELYLAWPNVTKHYGWLQTACERKVWKRWNSRGRIPLPLEEAVRLPGAEPDPADRAALGDDVRAAAQVLSREEMALFQRIADGYTLAQIADVYSLTVPQIRTAIKKARCRFAAAPAGPLESEEEVLEYCRSRLEHLPPQQEEVMTWALYGVKPDVIASWMGISANGARVNLHHAKTALAHMPGAPSGPFISELIRTMRQRFALDRSPSQLLRAAAAGEQEAWNHIVDDYCRLVWSIPRGLGLTIAEAADVSQTVWLRLVENLDTVKDADRLAEWLAALARRESLRVLRAQGRVPREPAVSEAGDALAGSPSPTPTPTREESSSLWAAFNALPAKSRDLLRAVAVTPSDNYAAVARAVGMPVSAVGPARSQALRQLKANLAAMEGPR
ncbi:RNA polymerase sigma factor (sigma-70 family) [Catenulispora sp. GP43]|uniref:sigma-70 family RNA polymerase sigma factor n=1 Tax=Catenulispora sp. GP43 TaxID=3156263 RepID=UPI0035110AF4